MKTATENMNFTCARAFKKTNFALWFDRWHVLWN